ncbi:MAG: LysM peptidoglycan-binding domain-containing protein, partial [Bacteroidota bacterium]
MSVRFLKPNVSLRLYVLTCAVLLLGSSWSVPSAMAQDSHTVKKGETLYGISRIYGLTVDELTAQNQLKNSTIYPDQVLNVASTASAANQRVAAPVEQETVADANRGIPTFEDRQTYADPYTTDSYDELTYLQRRRQAAYQEQDTYVSGANKRGLPTETTVAQKTYYQVKQGENLYQLAVRFGVQVEELREWNMIRNVRPGQTIVVRQDPVEVDMAQSARRTYASQTRTNRGDNLGLGGNTIYQEPASLNLLQLDGGDRPGPGEVKDPNQRTSTNRRRTATQQAAAKTWTPSTNSSSARRTARPSTSAQRTRSLGNEEMPLLSQLLHSPDKHLYLGNQVETGAYAQFEDAFLTNKAFYVVHKTLPVGTIVYMDIPNNAGFLELEVVGTLTSRNRVMVGLSRGWYLLEKME